jgi:hypothetical protein
VQQSRCNLQIRAIHHTNPPCTPPNKAS